MRARSDPNELWPWESMEPSEWNKLLTRSVKLNLINLFVSVPILGLILWITGNEDES